MVKQQTRPSPELMSLGGLLGWLYDMSFTRHYAPQVIKAVYWLVTVFYSLVAVVALVRLVQEGGPVRIVVGIIVVVVAYLLYLVIARIVLEVLIVFFRMGDDLSAIRATGIQPTAGPAHPEAQQGQPYFMPAPPPGRGPQPPPPPSTPFWAAPAPPPSSESREGPQDRPRRLGPRIEETAGFGETAEPPATEAIPAPEPAPAPEPRPADGGSLEEEDYPPEADGPAWIT